MSNASVTEPQAMIYRDFNIRFSNYNEADHTFKVWVEGETPNGSQMKPDHAVILTYDPKAFWKYPDRGKGGYLGDLERRRLAKEELFKLGEMLADLALPKGQIRSLFENNRSALSAGEGLRLRLRIDPTVLTQLPWDDLALRQTAGEPRESDFFALQRAISIVRTDTVESANRELPQRDKMRIVAVLSEPDDQDDLDLSQDQNAIQKAVEALNQAAGQEFTQLIWVEKPATQSAMAEALSTGADIFQFSGHAIFEMNLKGNIVLEKEEGESHYYPAEKLAQLLRERGVRLAVLSACESGRRNGENVWSGVAPALTREKLPAVIANQFKIKDESSMLIAAKVYPYLLQGYTVDEALFEARQAIFQLKGLKNRDWGVPTLYLHDESGILFPIPKADEESESAKSPFLRVANAYKQIAGEAIDAEIGKVTGGSINIESEIDIVKKGGKYTGITIDTFG